ncbi:hypothetical protein KIPB_003395 [Kipferlia bialata]|uniref:N-acetyltransferase domain-containing protein n=1 Tax=Kipferlia bialata TaxID=797122 RepID=A0A9K3GGM4_9EUKA|nr:hypothetical protein KIPB_003081 [Kipferlia bialata]GIQ82288.1 hypothetical protein KIPB_003395 [Kipferlia bialata]|eukprot:g3081.t1
MSIRRYQPGDEEDCLSVWENSTRLAHGAFFSEEFIAKERINHATFYLPKLDTWVYVDDGHAVGFMVLIGNEVGGLFVHGSHHGKGYGRALVDKARDMHGNLEVEVFENNPIGRRFYDRYGFVSRDGPGNVHRHEETRENLLRLYYTAPK